MHSSIDPGAHTAMRRIQAVGRPTSNADRERLDRAIDEHAAARRALDDAMTAGRDLPQHDRDQLQRAVTRGEARQMETVDEILRSQSTWRPRCEELSPRTRAELLLGLYPARRGWWVIVQDDTGTEAVVATPEKTISEVSFATALGLLERMSAITPDLAHALATTQAAMLARGEAIGRYRVWVR